MHIIVQAGGRGSRLRHHTWNKPMSEFFNFLKGIGFVFDMETQIGVVDRDGNFREAEIG
jgi:hypothetical protein